jgi:hypothetical protein
MKTIYLAALLLLSLVLTGCSSLYDVTLRSGNVTTSRGKPKLNERGYYEFTDVAGTHREIHQGQVRAIAPHASTEDRKNKIGFFNPADK